MKYRFFIPLVVVAALIFISCATETADVIQPTAIENIHFLPANIMLGTANIMLGNLDGRVPAEPMEDVASDQVLLKQANPNPGIAPIQSSPHGKTYSAWAADWWKWALETEASENPLIDLTGENCGVNQSDSVWFLAGSLVGPVTRECTVPSGRPLFFPLINAFYGAFLNDPPATRIPEFIRAQVTCIEDAVFPLVEIDGVAVANPEQYLEKSVIFHVQLPENNIFGVGANVIPDLRLSPSADEGFYLVVPPLTPGDHTIKWQASSADCGSSQNITYNLTVE